MGEALDCTSRPQAKLYVSSGLVFTKQLEAGLISSTLASEAVGVKWHLQRLFSFGSFLQFTISHTVSLTVSTSALHPNEEQDKVLIKRNFGDETLTIDLWC